MCPKCVIIVEVLFAQSCLTLCHTTDYSPPGSFIHGVFQGVELLFPSPGDLPNPGIEPRSPTLQADSLLSEPLGSPNKYLTLNGLYQNIHVYFFKLLVIFC